MGLRAAAAALGKRFELIANPVCLWHADYAAVVRGAKPDDFVYIDPPYDPVSKTANFTGYAEGGFGREQQAELAEVARIAAEQGVQVMLSNSDTKFVRSLYRGKTFRIERVMCPRHVNSDPDKRGVVPELVITGGYKR
jgi:DNA adenine methylase